MDNKIIGTSIWSENKASKISKPLVRNAATQTVVVGGGITGLTAASILAQKGHDVVVVRDYETAYSTGHLTEILDDDLSDLVSDFGIDIMRQVVGSCRDAINFIEKYSVDDEAASFSRLSAFKFTQSAEDIEYLKKEFDAAKGLNISVEWLPQASTQKNSLKLLAAIHVKNQAMIDPLAYQRHLETKLRLLGVEIFDDSRVTSLSDKKGHNSPYVQTKMAKIECENIVLATHTPLGRVASVQTRTSPYSSYAIAIKMKKMIPEGLYWDTSDPYFYFRPYKKGSDVWIFGGRDHKTGQVPDNNARVTELLEFALKNGAAGEALYKWMGELYESADGLPFIGRLPLRDSVYGATGFSGTGLTWGTVAGQLLADLVLGQENDLEKIFNPARVTIRASGADFLKENTNVGNQYFWHLPFVGASPIDEIKIGEGAIVTKGGKNVCAYRASENEVQFFVDICPHLKGPLHWNGLAKTWDCRCHGGRFKPTGEVLEGPVMHPLKRLECIFSVCISRDYESRITGSI